MKRSLYLLAVLVGSVAAVFLVLYDLDLLQHHTVDVKGNLEASVIWGTPTALVFLARSEWRHRQRERAAAARHDEQLALARKHHEQRMEHLDSLHVKVDALHEHLGIEPPAD